MVSNIRSGLSFLTSKGLVPTIASTSDYVEHRLCVKHLYGNWRKKYPGDELKKALWAAARSTTIPEFTRAMDNLKKLTEAAWKDMCDLTPDMWSRAAFSTHTCCDLQVNNMCEAFNSAILEYRDKPIISLVEGLKFYMTNRIVKLRDYMLRKTTFLDTSNNLIRPSNGPKGWPIVDATQIAPPYVRRAPGRPKKLRRTSNNCAATGPRGLKKSARIATNAVDPIGTQQSVNKP
ncbi:hypothetical protein L195_g007507 [Trifolium pratense]|uniref:Uncharacterized protein n=1 Tax=Trifolium pratense TaxID=57577 RepID=A0A2K3P6K9_TRIPR|nr:hypothetical protein L195_g007507 [Trifolium pratense]